jgi:hypothetical protein
MRSTEWHAPPELLAAYVDGTLDAVLGASLERHVDRCPDCRAAATPFSDRQVLEDAWPAIRAGAESPRPPWLVRAASRLGLPESTGVLLAATASLRGAWLSSAFVAVGFAVLATLLAGDTMLWPFLLVAPLIPVMGVAAAYGPSDDPFETLAVTAPYGRTRLVLVRTVAVLVTSVPGACLLGLALPGPDWVAAAWLGPALAMLSLLLAVASFVGPRLGAAVVAIVWCAVVLGTVGRMPATWPVEVDQQLAYLGVATAAAGILVVRSRRTRHIGAAL